MTTTPRAPFVVALATCVSLTAFASACNQDEPATYEPRSGNWTYQQTTVASNSCNADLTPDPLTAFVLDYDEGDTFDIELGAEDVTCEIDGTEFDCSDYVYSSGIPGADAVISWTRTWEGEFLSETEAEGNEITRVTCAGDDCNLIEDVVPCTTNITFEAMAL